VLNTAAIADPEHPVSLERLVSQFSPEMQMRTGTAWAKLAAVAVLVTSLALAWRYTPLSSLVTPQRVTAWVRAGYEHWWSPIALVLAYTPASYLMFPRPLITLACVVGFGAWLGFAYAMTGILLASATHYVAGRSLSRDTVRRLAGERLNRMTHVLRRHGLAAVTALRLVPAGPYAVQGMVAGAIRIKPWHFLLGTFLGMLPGVLAATVFGGQLAAWLEGGSGVNWWIVAAVLAVLAIVTLGVRVWFKRLEAEQAPQRGKPART
jgi:uncharacterized membrane protein YdjX (TVP38/TMEM64 family)